MPVGDAFSQWATALYNRFPNRPKRMSALDAANAMRAMAEARKARAESDKLDRGPGQGEAAGARKDEAQARYLDAQARAADRGPEDTGRSGGRLPATRASMAGPGGGMMAPGSGSALPMVAAQQTPPMAGAELDYFTPADYTPMLGGTDDFGGDFTSAVPGGDVGIPTPGAIPEAGGAPMMASAGGTTGIEGAGEGFGELSAVLNAPQDNTQGTPTPMDNAAYPGMAGTEPDYAVPMDTYARGTYASTAGGTVGEDEMVIPREMNPMRDMPDMPIAPVTPEEQAKFAPGVMQGLRNLLPSSETVNRAFTAPYRAVASGVQAVGDVLSQRPSTADMAQDISGRLSRGGLREQAPASGALPSPASPNEAPVALPAQLPASEIAANDRVIAASKAAIAKPQYTAADYYKSHPGVEGAWDRMKTGKTMGASALPGTMTGAGGEVGGMPPAQAPGQKQTMFTMDDASQANAEKMFDQVRARNMTSTGTGGGGMMSYDADTGKAISMTALPTDQERGAVADPYADAQRSMVTSLMQDYRAGKATREDVLAGLASITKMNEPTKAAQAKATEEGRTARAKMQIEAADKRQAATLAQRTAAQEKTLSSKVIDTEHEAREKMKDQYNKDYTKMMEIEDPEERNNRLMDLNKNFYANMLPPEMRQLAEVPNTFENYAYMIKKKAYDAYRANPQNKRAAELWAEMQKPEIDQQLKSKHASLLQQREAAIRNRK